MLERFCLLCLILSCRFVIGRLPADVLPINTFEDVEGRLVRKFSGVHSIVYVNRDFYVLAKNEVASLKVVQDSSNPLELLARTVITWPSSQSSNSLCKLKTGDEKACNNFIRIFTPKDGSDREFLVCGTHSFDPKCSIYTLQGDMFKKDTWGGEFTGKSICPFDPKQTGVFIYTGGDLYSATVEDFHGRRPIVYRYAVASEHTNLKGSHADDSWLLDPWFVKFVESGRKVYIFFKETAIEDGSELTYSRVGQICKHDEGGDHILRKQFTSYQKARLNCSYPGHPPFYFNELGAASDFFDMPGKSGQKILFAAMNTPRNSIWGSAVCAFLEQDIEASLGKAYLEQHTGEKGANYWLKVDSKPAVTDALGKCQFDDRGKSVLSPENLQFVRDHPLKAYAVPSWAKDGRKRVPIFMKLNAQYQFTAIAIDPVAGSTRQHFVIILGTSNGRVLKVIPPLIDSIDKAHFVGETLAFDEEQCENNSVHDREVRDIKIDKENGYILVAFASCVVSIPLCPLEGSTCQYDCIKAQDPYCAWGESKCESVLRPEGGLMQDVLVGDVSRFPRCKNASDAGGVKPGLGNGGTNGDGTSVDDTTGGEVDESNTTNPVVAFSEETTFAVAQPATGSLSLSIVAAAIGFAVAAFFALIIYFTCRWRTKSKSTEKVDEEGKSFKELSYADEKRNSHSSRQERPLSNHTQRQHSKRSNSSVDEEENFLDNDSEGNMNSIEKTRRKREKSANRKSTSSSYRREDSLEKPPNVNRQTSRESNPESGSNKEGFANEPEHFFTGSDAAQPPSPQNQNLHRTYSTSARSDVVPQRPNGQKQLRRQYSLQIPTNTVAVTKYPHHNLTPMPYSNQNPMDIHMQQRPNFVHATPPQGTYEPPSVPTWHPSPAKNHGMPRQYQTTSLDRKMLKAGSLSHPHQSHAIPHDGQQQPRGYSDTLPAPGMDDPKAHGRRRYPSESVVIGNRPHPFASKEPVYQSIEEETSPIPEQNSPTKFPTNMPPRNVGRMRPNHLPLGGSMEQQPSFTIPYSNPGTPMTEQIPRFAISPMQNTGHTLPTHLRRQYSEVPRTYATQQPHVFAHPQSAPNMKVYPPTEKISKSNPATPEWDGNHNNFFPAPATTSEMRTRNPSGKSTTPSTPNEYPGFHHHDVVPSSTARPSAETTYSHAIEPLESSA